MAKVPGEIDAMNLHGRREVVQGYVASLAQLAMVKAALLETVESTEQTISHNLEEIWQTFRGQRMRLTATGAERRSPASVQTSRNETTPWTPIQDYNAHVFKRQPQDGVLQPDTYEVVEVTGGHAILEQPKGIRQYQYKAPLELITFLPEEPIDQSPDATQRPGIIDVQTDGSV